MQPRQLDQASRAVFVLTSVAAAVTAVSALCAPGAVGQTPLLVAIMLPALAGLVAASWLLRRVRNAQNSCWAIFPLVTILAVLTLDLLTHDASAAAQIFLVFPALYGASQLPRSGATLIIGCCSVAEIIIVFGLLPVRTAAINAAYLDAALLTAGALLIHAAEQNEALVARLRRQAAIDPLTGLVTRRVLDSAARAALTGAAHASGTALMLLDVDRFKAVNDRYGHPAGDEVLVQLAAILTPRCRPGDVVSRMGGDEIALLMPGLEPAAAEQRAEQIRSAVAGHEFMLPDGQRVNVSISAGVAHAPTHAVDLRSLYTAADSALYEAKRAGRDRVAVLAAALPDRAY